ncbi:hypothetical protein E4188_23545 (plasmid) [Aeromonas media]|uniref:Uncharacterized protein n=2 Tax=Aeromonas TaxID=642 RepID=A0ABX6NZT0_AERME|nr:MULTISPECIES: hypothetical protein [Aeromonas]ASI21309.1 hypothetical protein CE456_00205 [Aeromonas salmonicida]QJT41471.1 hypothetical protein E4188_23545 [Aeromonas media]HDN9429527.1 hypothetical protein [Aeromonas salmonicida]HDN9433851.1 hypothetical protein [Aeromonas salmonicida]HDN9545965.1 hypothetical protein [Aeromonas salmonicida]
MWNAIWDVLMELVGMRPLLIEVIKILLMGGGVILLIELVKPIAGGSVLRWTTLQNIVLVCSLLFIGGRAYWVMHPSNDEVQLHQELNQYGL